jgi:hypothetical protein
MQHHKHSCLGVNLATDAVQSSSPSDTLWMNVHLFYNISITQWQNMLIAVGQLVGDKVHVLLFGAGMSQDSPPPNTTVINMVELSITMPESPESKEIIVTAADTIESELKKCNNSYNNRYKIHYGYDDNVPVV